MLLQDRDGVCGKFAVANALISLGVDVSLDDLSVIGRVAKTTQKNGTSKAGIVRVIKHYSAKPVRYKSKNKQNAWRWIIKWSSTYPVIVLVDSGDIWGHWGTVVGRIGKRVIFVDPSYPNGAGGLIQNNVHSLSKDEFMGMWSFNNSFYAIRVS